MTLCTDSLVAEREETEQELIEVSNCLKLVIFYAHRIVKTLMSDLSFDLYELINSQLLGHFVCISEHEREKSTIRMNTLYAFGVCRHFGLLFVMLIFFRLVSLFVWVF